jgi:hypothetical protein
MSQDEQAVYGFAVRGLGGGTAAPAEWPRWDIEQRLAVPSGRQGMSIWADEAWIGLGDAGELRLDRRAHRIELRTPAVWSDAALLHPGLSPAAAVISYWAGRAVLHCAAVLIHGRAWGLLGEQAVGKSTTAAHLEHLGCPVLTDDLLVVDGEMAYAGPRSVDLRRDAAALFGARPLGKVGGRERWRRNVGDSPMAAPVAGWVELCWSSTTAVIELSVGERLQAIDRYLGLPAGGGHVLMLADRPMLRFGRAQSPLAAGDDARRLLDTLKAC